MFQRKKYNTLQKLVTLALLLTKKSPDKIQERRNNPSQNKKEEQKRSTEQHTTHNKPNHEKQHVQASKVKITKQFLYPSIIPKSSVPEEEIYPAERKNAHLRPTKEQGQKKAHFFKVSSPSQDLDCTLS